METILKGIDTLVKEQDKRQGTCKNKHAKMKTILPEINILTGAGVKEPERD